MGVSPALQVFGNLYPLPSTLYLLPSKILLIRIVGVAEVGVVLDIVVDGEFVLYDALVVVLAHRSHTHNEIVVFQHRNDHAEDA